MTQKIKIKREPDGWHVTRPAFGFGSPSTTVYPTGLVALASLTAHGLGSAGAESGRSGDRRTAPWWSDWPQRPNRGAIWIREGR